ncbi:hypothetical protein MFLAVUS_008709 [Mucor flavus]|uniref:ATP adenylyltransferase n=1 Tax=Mucor flavus TaxID=439312 RepID=A0ABP9Z7V7_9FUNG
MSFLQLVENKFSQAKESKDLLYFESTETKKESNGVEFAVTLVPALAQKPSDNKNKDTEKPNPFLNPNPALVVKELDEHLIILNKFAVIPNHLLIVTKEFKKQSEPPMPNDLYEAFKVIQELGPSLAFFNCGDNSGASQAHKHIQVIPLKRDSKPQPPIKKLYDEIHDRHVGQIYAINKLPFVHVIMALDGNIIRAANDQESLTDYLGQMFFGILDAMFQQLRENATPPTTSYNFLMTEEFMMLIPRIKENATIEHNGKSLDLSINSLGYAGYVLAKTQEEVEAIDAQDNLMDVLAQTSVAWNPEAAKLEAERKAAQNSDLA